jgi:hypothetical protein
MMNEAHLEIICFLDRKPHIQFHLLMKTIFFFTFLFLISQSSFAAGDSLTCSFQGFKKSDPVVALGTASKVIDPKYDFSIEVPKTERKEWAKIIETLNVKGSVGFPKKGWIGVAFSSVMNPNDSWASLKLSKGQSFVLTKIFGDQSIQAYGTVN